MQTNVSLTKDSLRAAIDASGYKRGFIAQKMGISRMKLWKWETGASEPSISESIRLEEILGCVIYPRPDLQSVNSTPALGSSPDH